METKYTKEEVLKIINTLIGDINPIGETNIDNARFNNLIVLCNVVEELVTEIDNVHYKNKEYNEFSIKRASEYADHFMSKRLGRGNE